MKKFGFVLIAMGIGLLIALAFSAFFKKTSLISPVPDDQGIKVIYITPGSQ